MKQNLLTKVLLLFALIVGSVSSAWAQNNYSTDYTGNVTLSTNGGTSASVCVISINNTNYDGVKAGTGKIAGAVKITVPSGTKYLHLHLAGWNGETVSLSVTPTGYSDNIALTSNSGISGNSPFTFAGTPSADYYKVITFANALTENTDFTFTATGGKRFVVWGVTAESGDSPSLDPIVSISSDKIVVGGTAEISGPDGLPMTFSSDEESIATVDNDGVVTGVAEGTATITASWSAVENTYNAGSKEFTIIVKNPTVYEKVTKVNQLVVGNEYILVATENNKAMGAFGSNIRSAVDVTISEDKVAITNEEVAILTLGGTTNEWTFKASDNNEYLAYSGTSNQVHSNSDATANASMWIITNDFQLESANVSGRTLQYNSSQPRFACYTTTQKKAVLFVKSATPPVSASITSAGYATFSSDKNVDFSANADLVVYTATDNGSSVTLNEVESKQVPAKTAVVLKGAEGTYEGAVIASAEELGANDLHISDGETATSDQNIYVLANKSNGVGFYKWVGTSSLSAGKIYLKAASSAPFLGFDGDDTTGIYSVERGALSVEGCYTLDGRRVAQPTKGLYIVNGKKVMIK